MTERQEVRFNVYGKNNDIVSNQTGMKYDLIDLMLGVGLIAQALIHIRLR